jgi:hypothetical protein
VTVRISTLLSGFFAICWSGAANAAIVLATYTGGNSVTIPIELDPVSWDYTNPPPAPYDFFYGHERWVATDLQPAATVTVNGVDSSGQYGYQYWYTEQVQWQVAFVQSGGPWGLGVAISVAPDPKDIDPSAHPSLPYITNPIGQTMYFFDQRNQFMSLGSFEITGFSVSAIPEPATWTMMIFGLTGVGHALRRRRSTITSFARVKVGDRGAVRHYFVA